jgi:hypothetical protein
MAIVTIKRPTGLITLSGGDVAILQRLTNDGFYEYKISYEADPVKCLREKAITVRINVSRSPYVRQVVPVFAIGPQNPSVFTANLLVKSPRQKDAMRSQVQEYLLSILSDISSRIPNDLIRTIARAPTASSTPIRAIREVNTIAVSALLQQNVNAPVLETNLARMAPGIANDVPRVSAGRTFQRAANTLLNVHRIDPASVAGQRSNTVISAKRTFSGVKPARPATTLRAIQQTPAARTLVEAATTPNMLTSQIELSSQDMLPVVVTRTVSSILMTETLKIPAPALTSSEFYLVFEVLGSKGEVLEVRSVLVEHAINLTQLNLVTESPEVEQAAISKPGKVIFHLKQKDENAFGVNVYRKELNPGVLSVDATYSLAGRIDLRPSDGSRRFEDPIASLNPIIYRFIPFNRDEVLASNFASLVTSFEKPDLLLRGKVFRRQSAVSFNCLVKNSSIDVQIISVPPDPIVLKLVRRDKTLKEQNFTQVSDKVLLEGLSNGSIFIEDTTVKKNHVYEYAVILIYKDGSEEFSGTSVIQEFEPIETNIIAMELVDPKITKQGSGFDATFTIEYSLIKDDAETIRDYLSQQGIFGEFYQEILADKAKLDKVFGFVITRTNMNTSEIESCGVVDSLSFSDRRCGAAHGMKPIQEGYEYKYEVRAYLRNPETLFPTSAREVPIREGSSVTYSLKPAKWRHPVTLEEGNLVTPATIARNHANTAFTFGILAGTQTVTLSLGKALPTIQSAQVSKAKNGYLYLQWRVQGNTQMIDHFLIGMDVLGMQQNVGKAHNISSTGYFQMLDKLTNGESGAITYLITPVYFDYSKGSTTKTNQVVI